MTDSYDTLNNFQEISFEAGDKKTLLFSAFDEDGVTPLNISSGSMVWKLCQFGEFPTTILTKTGSVSDDYHFSITLDTSDTDTLSGKFIQQPMITLNGKTFIPGQGVIIISPIIPES